MNRSISLATGLLVFAVLLFACSFVADVKKQFSPKPVQEHRLQQVPTPTPVPQATPAPHKRHRHHHLRRASPSATTEPAETSTPEESPAAMATSTSTPTPAMQLQTPSPTPTPAHVSIGDDSANRSRVNSLIKQANDNLSKASRSNLTGDDAAAYDQAQSLVRAASNAKDQGDYLAASGLAQKAVVLSDRFAGGATP